MTETCKGQFRDVPFGDGCVDFKGFFEILAKLNYRGAFLIEMWTEKRKSQLQKLLMLAVGLNKNERGWFPMLTELSPNYWQCVIAYLKQILNYQIQISHFHLGQRE
ncbi:putative L-xylulose 5-phosphate 3-epimerase [Actinobacillus equuli]|nr:putative L-xylulose 5-phosphate 3-epimerase [Actinobacillus equuli]